MIRYYRYYWCPACLDYYVVEYRTKRDAKAKAPGQCPMGCDRA